MTTNQEQRVGKDREPDSRARIEEFVGRDVGNMSDSEIEELVMKKSIEAIAEIRREIAEEMRLTGLEEGRP